MNRIPFCGQRFDSAQPSPQGIVFTVFRFIDFNPEGNHKGLPLPYLPHLPHPRVPVSPRPPISLPTTPSPTTHHPLGEPYTVVSA